MQSLNFACGEHTTTPKTPPTSFNAMPWIYLTLAGLLEIGWAIGLKYSEGFTKPLPSALTIVTMIASFTLLSFSLRSIPLGTGYAVWTGIGAVGTAIAGMILFAESRDTVRLLCIALIIVGIIGLKFVVPTEPN
jgi:quaternary ammonium compound-resistance protein SugE